MKKEEIEKFSNTIEEMVYMKDISYMEAIVMYCEETGLEVELAAKLISEPLEVAIQLEAQKLKMVRPSANTGHLPF